MKSKHLKLIANLMLLSAGALWGGGFVVMKNALDNIGVNYLLAIRFGIGAIGLAYTLLNRRRPVKIRTVAGGIATGAWLYGAYAIQTYGLVYTTAGKNALITALYVVLVPFLIWALNRRRPEGKVMVAAVMMIAGIALLSLQSGGGINIGDLLTLVSSVFYAAHIICVDRYSRTEDVMQLTCLQFVFSTLFALLAALVLEEPPREMGADTIGALAYCGIAATLVAITFMNVGIKYASPEYASLFLSTESAFGCIFGVVFLQEAMTGRMWAGCGLILLALAVSQGDWGAILRGHKEKGRG